MKNTKTQVGGDSQPQQVQQSVPLLRGNESDDQARRTESLRQVYELRHHIQAAAYHRMTTSLRRRF